MQESDHLPLLHSTLRDYTVKALALLRVWLPRGCEVKIVHSYRSKALQDELYAKGRTTPGPIVTNARGGSSKHNHDDGGTPASKAVDLAILEGGKYVPDDSPLWSLVGASFTVVAGPQAIRWGGQFKNIRDYGHVELK